MKIIKSSPAYSLVPKEMHTGLLVSLLLHVGIIAICCILLPSVTNVSPPQVIHITFPLEAEFLESGSPSAAVVARKWTEEVQKKNVAAREKIIVESNNQSKVGFPEKNEIVMIKQAWANDSIGKNFGGDIVSEKTAEVNNTSRTSIAYGLDSGKEKAKTGEAKDQTGIVEFRFGEKGSPSFIYQAMPVYPVLARRMGKEGRVILKLLIDMNGKLQQIEVVERDDYGFTEAAIAAVKKSTYAPGYRNGERAAMRALLPVRFQLQ